MNKVNGKGSRAKGKGSKLSAFSFFLLVTCHLSLVTLLGCGVKHPTLSDAHLSAVKFNQRAESSLKNGDYENALRLYHEALKINRSIENIDGIAINVINITAVYRKLGNKDNANKGIDEILNSLPSNHNPLHLSEAAFLKAMLYMDESRHNKALEWADKSLAFCQNVKCSTEGKIYNLKGRIAILNGDVNSAIAHGNKGLEINKQNENQQEIANSLRILAETTLMKGEYEDAKKLYEDALSMDKTLGLSKKIAQDLMGIGNTYFKQGNKNNALEYFKRALSVSEAADAQQGIKVASEIINGIKE